MISTELKKEIFRRYAKHGFDFKTWEDLVKETKLDETKPVTCYYCKKELNANCKNNKWDCVSLDHKLPKYWGGKNTIENTVLCCAECNIVKGTMTAETYFIFLETLNEKGIKELVFNEMFPGRKAQMISRKNKKMLWELV